MSVVQITGRINDRINDCDWNQCTHWPFNNGLTSIVRMDCPDNLSYNQVSSSGQVSGLNVKIDSSFGFFCDECDEYHYLLFDVDDIIVTEGIVGVDLNIVNSDDSDDSSSDDDDDDDDDDELLEIINDNVMRSISLVVDTHWNCYCKTQKVCGCGCDSLHDGW